jgi:demethylmenaquinone methyltransferase/2-methoxy-6-polyprenyl-1,4-benzoquinol methylase
VTATQPMLAHRPKTPQAIFDRVAPYYDRFNGLLSLGFDRSWRRAAVQALALRDGERMLDVATGTGALALEVFRRHPHVHVTGCDLNERMLAVAQQRAAALGAPIELMRCDAGTLPFASGTFDAVSLAFAVDDMPDRDACIAEIVRVLRPGGRFALLELSQPDTQPFQGLYRLYLGLFGWLRGFRVQGYDHLAQEIRGYRGAAAIATLLARHGFEAYRQQSLTFGVARLHVATRSNAK